MIERKDRLRNVVIEGLKNNKRQMDGLPLLLDKMTVEHKGVNLGKNK